jgi:drug/metabolite transporter (DMT)-like permease
MSPIASAHLGMLLCAVIVGASFPLVGALSAELPPLLATAARFGVAAMAMLTLAGPVWRGGLPARTALLYAAMGLALAGFFGAMFWAAGHISALSMSAIYLSVPLTAYLLGRTFGVERPAPTLLALLVLGAAGALALASARNDGGLRLGRSELVFAAGCAAFALYPVLSRWGLNKGWLPRSAAERTLGSLIGGAILIGAAGVVVESPAALRILSTSDWLIVAYLGLVSSGLTFWLTQRATETLTPSVVTAYSYLTPFASLLLLLAREPSLVGWRWVPGSGLIIAAMALLILRDMTSDKTPTHAATPRLCLTTGEEK